jgi:hypothetical protein
MSAVAILRGFIVFCLIGLILCIATIYYALNAAGFEDVKLKIRHKPEKNSAFLNGEWFLKITSLMLGLISCGLVLYEILLLCNPIKFGYDRTGIARGVFYIFLGMSTLGLSADLGIASGIIMAFCGAVTLMVIVMIKCGALNTEVAAAGGKESGFSVF